MNIDQERRRTISYNFLQLIAEIQLSAKVLDTRRKNSPKDKTQPSSGKLHPNSLRRKHKSLFPFLFLANLLKNPFVHEFTKSTIPFAPS